MRIIIRVAGNDDRGYAWTENLSRNLAIKGRLREEALGILLLELSATISEDLDINLDTVNNVPIEIINQIDSERY